MHSSESSGQPSCCSCGGDAEQPEKTKTQDQQQYPDTGIQTLAWLVWTTALLHEFHWQLPRGGGSLLRFEAVTKMPVTTGELNGSLYSCIEGIY